MKQKQRLNSTIDLKTKYTSNLKINPSKTQTMLRSCFTSNKWFRKKVIQAS